VALVLFPHADLRTAKPRPALVVQADELQTGLPQVIVAMITSHLYRSNHPSRVTILLSSPEGQKSGLLTDSVVMTDNLAPSPCPLPRLGGECRGEEIEAKKQYYQNIVHYKTTH